jgi:hypothetical protein
VQKQSSVVLAVVGVGVGDGGGVAVVEGVMRISGTEAEIAAKVGVFYRLAMNCAKIGTPADDDVHEVRTRRGGAGGHLRAWMQVAATLGATPSAKRGSFEILSTPPAKSARKSP